jgi:serine protease inhibitor
VELRIPKVSIASTHDLGGVLTDMGIADLFTEHADLSGITQGAPLEGPKVSVLGTLFFFFLVPESH